MLTLASRLRGNTPVAARGMAALKNLLTDGGGPVYTRGNPDELKDCLQAVEEWLHAQD
jgi:hypothetical protein